jgi:hypothetical protein
LNSKINSASINNIDGADEDNDDEQGRIVFSENIVDEATMFAVDTGNTAIVNFDNDETINIDDL